MILEVKEFSHAMMFHRVLRGITQIELSRRLGICRVSVNRYELGRIEPRIDVAIRIAKELNFPLDDLSFTRRS